MASTPVLDIVEAIRPDLIATVRVMWDEEKSANEITRFLNSSGVPVTDEAVRRWLASN